MQEYIRNALRWLLTDMILFSIFNQRNKKIFELLFSRFLIYESLTTVFVTADW
jgi:hypothetical protein